MAGESVYTPGDVTEDLTAAAMWGDVQLLEGFLTNGADPNLPNSQGNTALHVACYYGERECASILLDFKGETIITTEGVECIVILTERLCLYVYVAAILLWITCIVCYMYVSYSFL